jgi:hypothetical protein
VPQRYSHRGIAGALRGALDIQLTMYAWQTMAGHKVHMANKTEGEYFDLQASSAFRYFGNGPTVSPHLLRCCFLEADRSSAHQVRST